MIRRKEDILTQVYLKSILRYELHTGKLFWIVDKGRVEAGDEAGTKSGRGYVEIKIDGKSYLAHRLAWLYMTGGLPTHEIDHINGNPSNNRWINLREGTHSQVTRPHRTYKTNISGYSGVHWRKDADKYRVRITVNNQRISLGHYSDFEEACRARAKAEKKYFGRLRRVKRKRKQSLYGRES
jgi:HNH endonuclease/AP2 domain